MTALLANLGWTLLHSLWQLTLIGAIAAILLAVAGSGRARVQYGIAYGALVLCLLVPVATFLHGLGAEPAPVLGAALSPALAAPVPALAEGLRAPWTTRLLALVAGQVSWIAAAWALGVLIMLGRLGGGWWSARRWRRQADPVPAVWNIRLAVLARAMGVGRKVLLLATRQVATPVALGLWRPVVLVPAALFTAMPEAYLEALLAHELAHIARMDYLFNFLQSVIEVVGFHHPVVWWLSRRIRTVREHLCDELAAKAIGEPRRLALALDALDDVQPHLSNPLALAARGGPLYERIHRLVRPSTPSATGPWALAPLLALLLPGAALALRAQSPSSAPIAVTPELVAQIDALALREGVDPQLLRSIAWAESGFNAKAKSPTGATGLLQVMPETARKFGASDLTDSAGVAQAGARFLKYLLGRYQGDVAKAVTAYTCGAEAVDAGKVGPESIQYRALVLEVLKARAVQPAPELVPAAVDGTLRRSADGKTWVLTARVSGSGAGFRLEILPEPVPGAAPGKALGVVEVGDGGDPVATPAPPSALKVILKIPTGTKVLVRCTDSRLGVGDSHLALDSGWGSFAFKMSRPS